MTLLRDYSVRECSMVLFFHHPLCRLHVSPKKSGTRLEKRSFPEPSPVQAWKKPRHTVASKVDIATITQKASTSTITVQTREVSTSASVHTQEASTSTTPAVQTRDRGIQCGKDFEMKTDVKVIIGC